ncbi:hypothetical protein IPV08_17005 [Methylobacterium sp. SD274]|uniref:hypothetical protein n=1 Tax=Methylobacterium sp. SD274 TaxID=2782009 RepID=UPI001A9671EE|nr:hypothetical protein [Methylobacterium sp. SD274]MBO1021661.1 hypothetical protein [Methylobacterium sp. SD274]
MARSTIKPVAGPVTGAIDRDTVEIGDTVSLFDLFGQLAKTPMDIRTKLMIFADDCRAYLQAAGLSSEAGSCEMRARREGFDHPSVEWYCASIVDLTAAAFACGERGDVWNAVSWGCTVARYSEQMRMLGYEPLIKQGINKRNDLAVARKVNNKQKQLAASSWIKRANRLARDIWSAKPDLSPRSVAAILQGRGEFLDRKLDTIRKVIAANAPKKVGSAG